MYKFRQTNDARMKEAGDIAGKRNRLPHEEFTYGIP